MHLYLFAIFLVISTGPFQVIGLIITPYELLPQSNDGCAAFVFEGEVKYEGEDSSSESCIWVTQGDRYTKSKSKIEFVINELTGSDTVLGIHWNLHKPGQDLESLILNSTNIGQIQQINSTVVAIVLHKTGPVTLSFSWKGTGDVDESEGQLWMWDLDDQEKPATMSHRSKGDATLNDFHMMRWKKGLADYTIDLGAPQHCPATNGCECLGATLFQAKENGRLEKLFSLCSPNPAKSVSSVQGPLLAVSRQTVNSTEPGVTFQCRPSLLE